MKRTNWNEMNQEVRWPAVGPDFLANVHYISNDLLRDVANVEMEVLDIRNFRDNVAGLIDSLQHALTDYDNQRDY